jgi:hypothetical protein
VVVLVKWMERRIQKRPFVMGLKRGSPIETEETEAIMVVRAERAHAA